jgi:DNA-binding transcriptional LysR family regulator
MNRARYWCVLSGPPLRDVGCFALVARHLSFSRAAAAAGLSQPAVSQAIGRLERSLGVRLFDRTSREVRLSVAGKALLPHAEALLATAAAFAAEATRQAVPVRPAIRLAYPPLAGVLVAQVARRLVRREPAIDVELVPATRATALAELAAGTAPAAIVGAPFPAGYTVTARFHVTVAHLAVPAGDRLALAGRVRPEQLARYSLLLPRNRPPGGMWARFAGRAGGPHRYRIVADDLDDFVPVLDLVAAGAGLLPVPGLVVAAVRRPDVRFVPLDLDGRPADLRLTYGLAWSAEHAGGHAGGHLSPELMALVQTVHETLRTR